MAIEVEAGQYLFRTNRPSEATERSEALQSAHMAEWAEYVVAKRRLAGQGAIPPNEQPTTEYALNLAVRKASRVQQLSVFSHNPIHDLESMYWLSLWEVLCSEFDRDDPNMTQEQWDDCIVAQGEFAADLFGDAQFRAEMMRAPSEVFLAHTAKFLPRVQDIMIMLDAFRDLLITRYRAVEEKLGTPGYRIEFSTAASNLHQDILGIFGEISNTILAPSDLRIVIKGEDSVPVKLVEKKVRNKTVDANTNTSAIAKRSNSDAGGEPSSRPPKLQRATLNHTTRLSPPPTTESRRVTRSQTGSLPKRDNGTRSFIR